MKIEVEEYKPDEIVDRADRRYVAGCDGKLTRICKSESYRARKIAMIKRRLAEEGC